MPSYTCRAGMGKLRAYAELPAANDALVVALLRLPGLAPVDTLRSFPTLQAMLAGGAGGVECTGVYNYRRLVITETSISYDPTTLRWDLKVAPPVFPQLGASAGAPVYAGMAVYCYDPDLSSGTDADLLPLVATDCRTTLVGTDVPVPMPSAGWARCT